MHIYILEQPNFLYDDTGSDSGEKSLGRTTSTAAVFRAPIFRRYRLVEDPTRARCICIFYKNLDPQRAVNCKYSIILQSM